ncbi:MAG: RidA family protein [Asticcacaulis sp.]|uniref:RidA family protein n=1 Tax=Asticcacaulis sp. TaxID=1872648 RepID=UPI0039E538ED
MIKSVLTSNAPPPAGHYTQALIGGGHIYISGQLPVRIDGVHQPNVAFETQARQALGNLLAILEAAGGTPDDLLKVTVYIAGIEHWPEFNRIYAQMLGGAKPARSVVPVPELHYGYLVEIDAVALKR